MTSVSVWNIWRVFRPEAEIHLFGRLLVIIYFLEVGLVLIVVPWTTFWDRNYFIEARPLVQVMLTTSVMRGSVSGVGVLNLGAAAIDLVGLFSRRPRRLNGTTERPPGGKRDDSAGTLREETYPPS